MRALFLLTSIAAMIDAASAADLNRDQRLIVACHRLDIDGVVIALRDGANASARFGQGNTKVFEDPWTFGWPMAAKAWTPLIAVASASEYPDPPCTVQNTSEDLEWSRKQRQKIPRETIELRKMAAAAIARILMSHNAEIDADDGHGATALYEACYEKKAELAKLLMRFGANVNTRTGLYIDGTYNTTPLHRASWSPDLTKMLLEKGADRNAKDSKGHIPADWATDPVVKRLYRSP